MAVSENRVRDSDQQSIEREIERLKDSDVGEVSRIVDNREVPNRSYEFSIKDSQVDRLGELVSSNRGIVDSDISEVQNILTEGTGIKDSDVGIIENIASAGRALWNVGADQVGNVYSSDESGAATGGAVRESEIGELQFVDAHKHAIVDSDIERIGTVKAGGRGVDGTQAEEIELIEALTGVSNSDIDYIEEISSRGPAVTGGSHINRIDKIDSGGQGVSKGRGASDPTVDEIGFLDADDNAVGYYGNVGRITEGVNSGGHVLKNSSEVEILRELVADDLAFADSQDNLFVGEYISAESLDGNLQLGESESHSNMVISDEVDLDRYDNSAFVITSGESERFVTMESEFEELKEKAQDKGTDFLESIRRFNPKRESFSDLQDILNVEERQAELVAEGMEQFDINDSEMSKYHLLTSTFPLEGIYHVGMMDKISDDLSDKAFYKMMSINEFGKVLSDMDPDSRDQMYERLKTDIDHKVLGSEINPHTGEAYRFNGDENLADKLVNLSLDRKFHPFMDEEYQFFEDLMGKTAEKPNIEGLFDDIDLEKVENIDDDYDAEVDGSPYLDVLGELSEAYEEDLRFLSALSDEIKFEGEPINSDNPLENLEIVKKLKDKEVGRHAQINNSSLSEEEVNQQIDDEVSEYKDLFEKNLSNQLQDYLEKAIVNLGHERAEQEYEKLLGNRKDIGEVDKFELGALMVSARADDYSELDDTGGWEKAQETVRKLLENGEGVYEVGENLEWINEQGYEPEELLDPDLSVKNHHLFEEAPGSRSALKVDIDEENVETDVEERKQNFWEDVVKYSEELGIELDEETPGEGIEGILDQVNEDQRQSQAYSELKDAIEQYGSADNLEGGVPDNLTIEVASPMETTHMGKGLQSCHDVEYGSFGWASVSNAVKPNSMVFYGKDDEDEIQARVKAFITDNDELVYHNLSKYKKTEIDTSEYFREYMSEVSDELDLELKHSEDLDDEYLEEHVPELEAHEHYLGE